jgi:hypothetical protein
VPHCALYVAVPHCEQNGMEFFSAGGRWECTIPGNDYVSDTDARRLCMHVHVAMSEAGTHLLVATAAACLQAVLR